MSDKSVFEKRPFLAMTAVLVVGLIFSDFLLAQIYTWATGDTFYNKITNPANISEKQYRISSDIYHHDLKKNVRTTASWGPHIYPMVTNSLGFRDHSNRKVPLRSDKYRIVFMGDSFVEGSGVAYPDSFVGMLTEKFGDKYDILNAGIISYAPTAYYRKARYYLENYGLRFDELVLFVDISDISDEVETYADFDPRDADLAKLPTIIPNQVTTGRSVKQFFRDHSILYAIPRNFKIKKVTAAATANPDKNRQSITAARYGRSIKNIINNTGKRA